MPTTLGLVALGQVSDERLSEGEMVLRTCHQCGTCSGICPMVEYMDYSPRALNDLQLSGHYDEALRSKAIWVCTSCYACTLSCPRQIPVTDVIYGLKRAALQAGVYPRRFTIPVMAKEFIHFVGRRGRSSESWLSVQLYLRTRPLELMRHMPLGWRLFKAGRLRLGRERVRHPEQIQQMLKLLATPAGGGRP